MRSGPDIAHVAALLGDPARAAMLSALMDGRALTAGELAVEAGITPQTASGHIAKLRDGGLVRQRSQGRHRYVALAGADVAGCLEELMALAEATGHRRTRPGPADAALRHARTCYDHLAGGAATALYDRLTAQGWIEDREPEPVLTEAGRQGLARWGVDPAALVRRRGPLARACLDWSERRTHLGGTLGRAILGRMTALGWVRRQPGTRALAISPSGACALAAFRASVETPT